MDYLIISSLSFLCYPIKRRTLETAFSSQIYLDLPILPPDSPCQTIWITGMAQLEASCLNQRFVPWRTVEMLWGGTKGLAPTSHFPYCSVHGLGLPHTKSCSLSFLYTSEQPLTVDSNSHQCMSFLFSFSRSTDTEVRHSISMWLF